LADDVTSPAATATTFGPAVRRALEATPEIELVAMDWDERWAEVRFLDPAYGYHQLQTRLMSSGAWCDMWPEEVGS
jgi:hypothetical protein